jgi:uncharacterized protein YjbI with pentapeptide repeats
LIAHDEEYSMQPPNDRFRFESVFTTEEKAALRNEVFVNREFVGVDFSGADLRGARFEHTSLVRCNLAATDLRGARFNLCSLREVVLTDAVFGDNRFDGTMLVETVGLSDVTRTLIEHGGGSFQRELASLR